MWQRKVYIALSGVITLLIFVVVIWVYPSLPEKIPTPYNFLGEINRWGERSVVWWLLGVEVFTIVLLSLLAFFPQIHSYPIKVTDENREALYHHSSLFVSELTLFVTLTFAYGLLILLQMLPMYSTLFTAYLIFAYVVMPIYNFRKMIKLCSA